MGADADGGQALPFDQPLTTNACATSLTPLHDAAMIRARNRNPSGDEMPALTSSIDSFDLDLLRFVFIAPPTSRLVPQSRLQRRQSRPSPTSQSRRGRRQRASAKRRSTPATEDHPGRAQPRFLHQLHRIVQRVESRKAVTRSHRLDSVNCFDSHPLPL